jgi:hypothetical protein
MGPNTDRGTVCSIITVKLGLQNLIRVRRVHQIADRRSIWALLVHPHGKLEEPRVLFSSGAVVDIAKPSARVELRHSLVETVRQKTFLGARGGRRGEDLGDGSVVKEATSSKDGTYISIIRKERRASTDDF